MRGEMLVIGAPHLQRGSSPSPAQKNERLGTGKGGMGGDDACIGARHPQRGSTHPPALVKKRMRKGRVGGWEAMMLAIGARHPQRGTGHHPSLKNTDADRVGGDEWRRDLRSRSHASQTGVHLLLYKNPENGRGSGLLSSMRGTPEETAWPSGWRCASSHQRFPPSSLQVAPHPCNGGRGVHLYSSPTEKRFPRGGSSPFVQDRAR